MNNPRIYPEYPYSFFNIINQKLLDYISTREVHSENIQKNINTTDHFIYFGNGWRSRSNSNELIFEKYEDNKWIERQILY